MLEKLYASRTALYWAFQPHPQGRKVPPLSWADFIDEGVSTRSRREALRTQVQTHLDAWARHLITKTSEPPSSITVGQVFYRLRTLARWMAGEGLSSFSKLEPESLEGFFKHLVDKEGFKVTSEASLKGYKALLKGLWTYRGDVPRTIRFDPEDVVASILKRMVLEESTGWLPLKENEALELIQDAFDWVENVAPDVAVLISMMHNRRGEVLAKCKKRRTAILRGIYADLSETENYKRVAAVLGSEFPTKAALVRNAYRLTLGASLNLIFGLIGMRAGEVVILSRECGKEEGPSHERVYRVFSIESKRHRSRSWVTTEFTKPAVDAIQAMFPWVQDPKDRLLHVFGGSSPVPLLNRKTRPLGQESLSLLLNQFAFSPHRGRTLSSPIHPHRWRHTFARFAMYKDKTALGPLAEHFGHVWRWITDAVYSTARDKGMLALFKESDLEQMRAGFAQLLTSPVVAGKGAAQFEEMRREVQQRTFQGKSSMEAMIDVYIKRGTLKLAPCSWGYCVYEQSLSACKGSVNRPNDVTRNATLCGGCSNFVVTPRHHAFWDERHRSDEEFLARSDIPEQARIHVVARKEVTEGILRRLLKND